MPYETLPEIQQKSPEASKAEVQEQEPSLEIERRFLVDPNAIPSLEGCKRYEIRQGYLPKVNGVKSRLRQSNDTYYLTRKSGSGLVRQEDEIEITEEEFLAQWPKIKRSISKTRFVMPLEGGGGKIEIDFFHNDETKDYLEGFCMAEVEFDSKEAAENFVPPEWFGREVTDTITSSKLARGLRPPEGELVSESHDQEEVAKVRESLAELQPSEEEVDTLGSASVDVPKEVGPKTLQPAKRRAWWQFWKR